MTTATAQQGDIFNASITVDGADVSIVATNIDALQELIARLRRTETTPATAKPPALSPAVGAAEKQAVLETKVYPDGTKATGTAPLPDQSPVPVALNYNDVKAKVQALLKVDPSGKTVLPLLAQFKGVSGQPCDHANKLQLADYAAFIAKADAALGVAA